MGKDLFEEGGFDEQFFGAVGGGGEGLNKIPHKMLYEASMHKENANPI